MAYATIEDVENSMIRTLSSDEERVCSSLLDQAALLIDAFNKNADAEAKKIVSVRAVVRALGNDDSMGVPMGASQGSMSGLGYAQSWTMPTDSSVGQIYIDKNERKMLGVANNIGASNPLGILTGGSV